jgi:hypothetical protein
MMRDHYLHHKYIILCVEPNWCEKIPGVVNRCLAFVDTSFISSLQVINDFIVIKDDFMNFKS